MSQVNGSLPVPSMRQCMRSKCSVVLSVSSQSVSSQQSAVGGGKLHPLLAQGSDEANQLGGRREIGREIGGTARLGGALPPAGVRVRG